MPTSLAARLDARHVLLTGVTGFVGEALLHLLLSEVPGCRMTVLVRAQGVAIGRGPDRRRCSTRRSSPRWSRPPAGWSR